MTVAPAGGWTRSNTCCVILPNVSSFIAALYSYQYVGFWAAFKLWGGDESAPKRKQKPTRMPGQPQSFSLALGLGIR
jgi:hypothetical protein